MPNRPTETAHGRRTILTLVLPTILAAGVIGCSGKVSDDSPDAATDARTDTPPTVPADKRLDTTSAEERARICDWTAAQLGGYGTTVRCPDGSVTMTGPENREDCLRTFPTGCSATVAQLQACVSAIARMDWCRAVEPPPKCNALRDCGGEEEPVPSEPIDAGTF